MKLLLLIHLIHLYRLDLLNITVFWEIFAAWLLSKLERSHVMSKLCCLEDLWKTANGNRR